MSVKLTKQPVEQQSHDFGRQWNANKPLSHNCIVKDSENSRDIGAIQSCKHASLNVTCHKLYFFLQSPQPSHPTPPPPPKKKK